MLKIYNNQFIGLMYHGLDSFDEPSESIDNGELIYVVDENDFEGQMSYLAMNDIPVVTLSDLKEDRRLSVNRSRSVSVIITFDDGHISNYTRAFPILKRYGYKAYFFITTDWIGKDYYMTEDMIRELHDAGMIIGSHGKTHRYLSDINSKEVEHEIVESKLVLENILQSKISSFSLPGGRDNKKVLALIKKRGFSQIFNSIPTKNNILDENWYIHRVAIKSGLNMNDYTDIVSGKNYLVGYVKFLIFRGLKRIFGNRNYQLIREIIIS